MLGWDAEDTPLHLEDVAQTLTDTLAWPDDEADQNAWRSRWRSAFELRAPRGDHHRRSCLPTRLAGLARRIRGRIGQALEMETAAGPLTTMMEAFRESLVADLTPDGFADMYAQTIALRAAVGPDRRPGGDRSRGLRPATCAPTPSCAS